MLGGVTRTLVRNSAAIKPSLVRNVHYISGPPKHRISQFEKAAMGSIIVFSMLAIPAWVLIHLEDYKGGNKK
ncbi:hypothetical protein CHUAL_006562 [Chamberlinius hualienensis]